MNPNLIPDHETMAMCKAGSFPEKYYLFYSKEGCYVVRHERRINRLHPEKSRDEKTRLGYWRDIHASLPAKVFIKFSTMIIEYAALRPEGIG